MSSENLNEVYGKDETPIEESSVNGNTMAELHEDSQNGIDVEIRPSCSAIGHTSDTARNTAGTVEQVAFYSITTSIRLDERNRAIDDADPSRTMTSTSQMTERSSPNPGKVSQTVKEFASADAASRVATGLSVLDHGSPNLRKHQDDITSSTMELQPAGDGSQLNEQDADDEEMFERTLPSFQGGGADAAVGKDLQRFKHYVQESNKELDYRRISKFSEVRDLTFGETLNAILRKQQTMVFPDSHQWCTVDRNLFMDNVLPDKRSASPPRGHRMDHQPTPETLGSFTGYSYSHQISCFHTPEWNANRRVSVLAASNLDVVQVQHAGGDLAPEEDEVLEYVDTPEVQENPDPNQNAAVANLVPQAPEHFNTRVEIDPPGVSEKCVACGSAVEGRHDCPLVELHAFDGGQQLQPVNANQDGSFIDN